LEICVVRVVDQVVAVGVDEILGNDRNLAEGRVVLERAGANATDADAGTAAWAGLVGRAEVHVLARAVARNAARRI
jgi:hypothetical protein